MKNSQENERVKFKERFKARLYNFVLSLFKLISALPRNEITKVISNQLGRSGSSILANYVEAQAASSRREFSNFFRYSLKSANESEIWLELLRDTDNGDKKIISGLLKELDEIEKIFASSIIKLTSRT